VAALPGSGLHGSGDMRFDLQSQQSISTKRGSHDVATHSSSILLDLLAIVN
jgi:hypothetical protein